MSDSSTVAKPVSASAVFSSLDIVSFPASLKNLYDFIVISERLENFLRTCQGLQLFSELNFQSNFNLNAQIKLRP